MELHNDDGDRMTPRTMLGRRLRRARETAGQSLRGLAEQVGYPHTYIGRVERGEQLPSKTLAEALDTHFGADGLFCDLLDMAQATSIPNYGRTVVDSESEAARIQVFTSSIVPGLLQTEEYARELIGVSLPWKPEDRRNELVERRMRRKSVLNNDDPPFFWAIMDESALKRPMGSNKCMIEQIATLLDASLMPNVTVQVLPFDRRQHSMLGGSLSLLTLRNGSAIGYVESFGSGETTESPKRIIELTHRFDVARSRALPEDETADLLRVYQKEYEDAHKF